MLGRKKKVKEEVEVIDSKVVDTEITQDGKQKGEEVQIVFGDRMIYEELRAIRATLEITNQLLTEIKESNAE